MYFIACCFGRSNGVCKDARFDISAFREFRRTDLGHDLVPDAIAELRFGHLLHENRGARALLAEVGELLLGQDMKLLGGTFVDTSLIAAPSPTENLETNRDAKMHQSNQGHQGHRWYFGVQMHVHVYSNSGLIHRANVTAGNARSCQGLPKLPQVLEARLYCYNAHRGKEVVGQVKYVATSANGLGHRRGFKSRPLTDIDRHPSVAGRTYAPRLNI